MRKVDFPELYQELKDQNKKKFDINVPSQSIKMENGKIVVHGNLIDGEDGIVNVLAKSGISETIYNTISLSMDVLETAHDHISTKLEIPKRYYQRMTSAKNLTLLDSNVNHWIAQEEKKKFFLRTFVDKEKQTGVCRAFLSDKFKVIDNFDVLLAVYDAIRESKIKLEIEYCDITDKKMYIRFINKDIVINSPELLKNYRLPNGNGIANTNFGIMSGFIISNSEVGHGQFSIAPRAVVLACQNGMTFNNDKFAKTHLGARMEEFSIITTSEETHKKNQELIISQIKDAINFYNKENYFAGKIQELEAKGQRKLENPIECCKNVTNSLSISDDKEREILNFFVKSGDFTAFGVTQALTYFAHETTDADEQFELESNAVGIMDSIDKFDVIEKKSTVKRQMVEN